MNHNIREIYTKAIVAKGKKLSKTNQQIKLNLSAECILGVEIMNHQYHALFNKLTPMIEGTYDLHIWYAYDNESVVEKHVIKYQDDMQVVKKEDRELAGSDQIYAICLNAPHVLTYTLDNQYVNLEIEKEMLLEITGETCIRVEVADGDESWDDIDEVEFNSHFIK